MATHQQAKVGRQVTARKTLVKILATDRSFVGREAAETLPTELCG